MSRYDIAHRCGHTETHDIKANAGDLPRRKAWLADGDCSTCYALRRNAQFAQDCAVAAAEAAELAEVAGLPTLQGSDKQVAWALTLRRDALATIEAEITRLDRLHETTCLTDWSLDNDILLQALYNTRYNIKHITSAKAQIDISQCSHNEIDFMVCREEEKIRLLIADGYCGDDSKEGDDQVDIFARAWPRSALERESERQRLKAAWEAREAATQAQIAADEAAARDKIAADKARVHGERKALGLLVRSVIGSGWILTVWQNAIETESRVYFDYKNAYNNDGSKITYYVTGNHSHPPGSMHIQHLDDPPRAAIRALCHHIASIYYSLYQLNCDAWARADVEAVGPTTLPVVVGVGVD